jgi:hypothetical protein
VCGDGFMLVLLLLALGCRIGARRAAFFEDGHVGHICRDVLWKGREGGIDVLIKECDSDGVSCARFTGERKWRSRSRSSKHR